MNSSYHIRLATQADATVVNAISDETGLSDGDTTEDGGPRREPLAPTTVRCDGAASASAQSG